jgi:hypothetical protein
MKEKVNHPSHYNESKATCSKCGHHIECIDVVGHMSFNLGNSVKYIWRCDLKNDAIEDLKKSAWYINQEIKQREKELNHGKANEEQNEGVAQEFSRKSHWAKTQSHEFHQSDWGTTGNSASYNPVFTGWNFSHGIRKK